MSFAKTLLSALFWLLPFALLAQTANRFDLVITEIMADPTPQVGLPNAEYIEVLNRSATPYNLRGWRLADGNGEATINTDFQLMPDSAVVLCSPAQAALLRPFGTTLGLSSFPSLDNGGETLVLRSPDGVLVHAVSYSIDWLGDSPKKEGGWSLEMVDPVHACTGSGNWKASTDAAGGTPGRTNSVNGRHSDEEPPRLLRSFTPDSLTVVLLFNEPLDSASAANSNRYAIAGTTVLAAQPLAPQFDRVLLTLAAPLAQGTVYSIVANNLQDCAGNSIGSFNAAPLGRPTPAAAADVVLNEILFNPRPGGFDYVELFNRSNKVIDLHQLYLAGRTSGGTLTTAVRLSPTPWYLFPGQYAVATEDRQALQRLYLVKEAEGVLQLAALPSLPDDEGLAVLTTVAGEVVDEVAYDSKWHFALLTNEEGVALERIDPALPTQDRNNWTSAASTAGFGTPGYRNSQYRQNNSGTASIEVAPGVFSPDNDGIDDGAFISYQTQASGLVANVFLFDANGRQVRHLVKNATLGGNGRWLWDGLDEKGQKLPVGRYIVYTELFGLEGKKQSFRHSLVLARRIN